jgi:ABC-type glycerol-3-phosphate transport system substrate-binding protein
VVLPRVFSFPDSPRKDLYGNDIKPRAVELPGFKEAFIKDSDGYANGPLAVFLSEGKHALTLLGLREKMQIRKIVISGLEQGTLEFSTAISMARSCRVLIEAENPSRVSSQTLGPEAYPSSPSASPSSPKLLLVNSIGGESFSKAGQWIEWDFSVPETGLYDIDMNVLQNFKRGLLATREISIDGNVVGSFGFGYKQGFRAETIFKGVPLESGSHVLRMEASLGSWASIITLVESAVSDINAISGKLTRLAGVSPDPYRDYQIEKNLPGLGDEMRAAARKLDSAIEQATVLGGSQGERGRVLVAMRDQLEMFAEDVDLVTRSLDELKSNASACGEWAVDAASQPLQIDRILVRTPDEPKLESSNGFFANAWFEIQRLFYSYTVDYSKVGSALSQSKEPITVWTGSGRDQAEMILRMIEEDFTPNTGIPVNLQIVDMGTLLQATMAGQAPDAAIQVGEAASSLTYGQRYGQMAVDLPLNYGLRGAAYDLASFSDFANIKQRFDDSALAALEFDGACYALPETQTFPLMFYRKDVLAELGVGIPETWEDARETISSLARSNLVFGLAPSEQMFATFLLQKGGSYYDANRTESALGSVEAIEAFKAYCELFTDYGPDKEMGASGAGSGLSQRFRSGEAPIVIADMGLRNELEVSASSLRGLWGMAPIPGFLVDGEIHRQTASGITSCLIPASTKRAEESWELLKWWTSAPVQASFSRRMESLLGPSARAMTANLEAFNSLPWTAQELSAISAQRAFAKGIEQAPGGYITYRSVNNAFYMVATGAKAPLFGPSQGRILMTPEEALSDKLTSINSEIKSKREEFGIN